MKLKLDENLGERGAALLRAAGYDVATVPQEDLASATDTTLIQVCRQEFRALVTLDSDFGNPLLYKPADYAGIAVLRLPSKPTAAHLLNAIETSPRAWPTQISRASCGSCSRGEFASTSLISMNRRTSMRVAGATRFMVLDGLARPRGIFGEAVLK